MSSFTFMWSILKPSLPATEREVVECHKTMQWMQIYSERQNFSDKTDAGAASLSYFPLITFVSWKLFHPNPRVGADKKWRQFIVRFSTQLNEEARTTGATFGAKNNFCAWFAQSACDTCGTFCPIIWHRQLLLVNFNETRPIKADSQSSGVLSDRTRTLRLEFAWIQWHRNQHAAGLPSRMIKMQEMWFELN